MKFNHLNVPTHWRNYWSRYPEGHTILESLISWVSQVDSMVDNQNTLIGNVEQFRNEIDAFVGRFDERLQTEVTQTLKDWQASGFLDFVINIALQWQLDDYITANEQDKLSLHTQLEQTVKRDDTGVLNLNVFDEATRSTILGMEPGTINAVLGVGNVTPLNTNFFEKSKNLFNKATVTTGHLVSHTTGELAPDPSFYTSDFIMVEPGATYTRIGGYAYAFYNSDKTFISGGSGETMTAPTDAYYVRITTATSFDIDTYQFEKGSVQTPYVPYFEPYISIEKIGELKDKSIGADKTTFIEGSFNLYDVKTVETGFYYEWNTGKKVANPSYSASQLMNTPPGNYHNNRQVRFLTFYNDMGEYVGGINAVSKDAGFEVPQGATKTIASVDNLFVDDLLITAGQSQKYFMPYGDKLASSVVPSLVTPTYINLPDTLYATVGTTLDIFFSNIILGKWQEYDYIVNATVGKTMADRWSYTPTKGEAVTIEIEVYQHNTRVAKKSVLVIASAIGTKNLSALVLGDSTVNANFMTQRLLDLYSQEDSNLTLIGTRGVGANKSEGRGGWGAATYRTGASIYGEVNPFYSPSTGDFNFAYYMANQGYDTPDHVIIQLGINDTFGAKSDDELYTTISQIKKDLDFIINSIKNYSSAIKIGVVATIPPNANQDAFGEAYGNTQTQWRYKRNNTIWTRWLVDTFQYREDGNVRLIPMHHNINTDTDFRDGVHPKDTTEFGYGRMGDSVYSYLKRIG